VNVVANNQMISVATEICSLHFEKLKEWSMQCWKHTWC